MSTFQFDERTDSYISYNLFTQYICEFSKSCSGGADIVRGILDMCSDYAQKTNVNGNSPLHYACSKGHREITWMLLKRDVNLALQYNNNGYTPLHLAAIRGNISVLEDFALKTPAAFHL